MFQPRAFRPAQPEFGTGEETSCSDEGASTGGPGPVDEP